VIAENLDWLCTPVPPARQRWGQDVYLARAMKKPRGENALPVEITSLERTRSRASKPGKNFASLCGQGLSVPSTSSQNDAARPLPHDVCVCMVRPSRSITHRLVQPPNGRTEADDDVNGRTRERADAREARDSGDGNRAAREQSRR
jgi:hypothetical protein